MPIRCSNGDTTELAYEHDVESWKELRGRSRDLRFDCCDAGVVLKTSKLGTRYFAHKARGECSTAPETAEHLKAKSIICRALGIAGWSSIPEHRLDDPEGLCIADVFGRRSPASTTGIAFEVQWSPQTLDETRRRTERYHRHGLRTLWLMRQFDIPMSKDVPAVRIAEEGEEFGVYLPKVELVKERMYFDWISPKELRDASNWERCGSLEQFVIGVVSGRFKFGFPDEIEGFVTADARIGPCWRCGRKLEIFCGATFTLPAADRAVRPSYYLSLEEIGDAKDSHLKGAIVSGVNRHLVASQGKPLTMRYSKTVGSSYLANSCGHCGALFGNFFLGQGRPWSEVDISWKFPVRAKITDFQELFEIVEHWSFLDLGPRKISVDTQIAQRRRGPSISIDDATKRMAGLKSL